MIKVLGKSHFNYVVTLPPENIALLLRFFKKNSPERARQPVMCLAPGSTDKIVVARGCDYVIQAVRNVINQTWTPGIQNERVEEIGIERLHEFKLRGNPW
jgi:hypothetical protein